MTENQSTGGTVATDLTTPEGVRAEVGRVMSDPTHQHYADWNRGGKQAQDYVHGLYERLHGKGTVEIGESLRVGGEVSGSGEITENADETARNELILAPLRQEWGTEFDTTLAAAQVEARQLFSSEDGSLQADQFADLGSRIRMQYGTKGETLALKFLADLGRIRKGG